MARRSPGGGIGPGAHYLPGSGTRVRLADGRVVSKYQAEALNRERLHGTRSERAVRRQRAEAKANMARQTPRASGADVARAVDQMTPAELQIARYGTSAQIAQLQRDLARDEQGRWSRVDRRGRRILRRSGRPNPFWYH
jgi:hypothetical protein